MPEFSFSVAGHCGDFDASSSAAVARRRRAGLAFGPCPATGAGANQDHRRHGGARPAAMAAIHRDRARLVQAGQHRDRFRHRRGKRRPAACRRHRINIAHSGYPDFARASLAGAPVKIIINDIVASPYAVFAKPHDQDDRRSQGQGDEHRRRQRHHAHLSQAVPGLRRPEDDRRRHHLCQGRGRPLRGPGGRRRRRHDPEPADLLQGDVAGLSRTSAT